MADSTRYFDSSYAFISPIRYFKANDPYYYEIDNLPLKQLEESQNFLKDQIDGIIQKKDDLSFEIDRSGFSELKPYATGNDRKVRVKPGRYTARVNDAYTITPFQAIEQIAGLGSFDEMNTWRVQTNVGDGTPTINVTGVLQAFQDGVNGGALNLNGLVERTFVFSVDDEDGRSNPLGPDILNIFNPDMSVFDNDFGPDDTPLYPNYIGALLKHTTAAKVRDLTLIKNIYSNTAETLRSGSQQGRAESEFIKRWRGVTRTSIVDVPEELDITIPDFDESDFYYINSEGTKVELPSPQRIDLVFVYSKPIDSDFTTIPKFDANGQPTVLTKPVLGIVKGAGIGISRQTGSQLTTGDDRVNLQSLDGIPLMLSHPGDSSGNNGFQVSGIRIRGSFPSPDDLMNLAPLLSESLETTAFPLIGQSIFPIAYVRVQNTGGGSFADLVTGDDIIDIRPFFRTTELTYNERAGIAAATPQASIANPFVTEAHLGKVNAEMYKSLDDRISAMEGSVTTTTTTPSVGTTPAATTTTVTTGGGGGGSMNGRPIAGGQVLGGYWGPEGALIKHAKNNTVQGTRNTQMNQFVDLIEQEFGYPNGSIPYFPDWDKATWYVEGNYTGDKICDYINVGCPWLGEFGGAQGDAKYMPPWINVPTNGQTATIDDIRTQQGYDRYSMYQWGPDMNRPFTGAGSQGTALSNLSRDQRNSLNSRFVQINFVKKRIKLNFNNTPWVRDYHVKVNLLHCTPLSEGKHVSENSTTRNSSQVWIQKYKDYFVICVAWAGTNVPPLAANNFFPWADRDNPEKFVGFAQPQIDLIAGGPWSTYKTQAAGFSENVQPNERDAYFESIANREAGILSTGANIFGYNLTQLGGSINSSQSNYTDDDYFNPVVPILYPSVQWEVIGLSDTMLANSLGSARTNMRSKDPIVICS